MIPLYCVRTSNCFQMFIVLALFYIDLCCFQFAFTVKKTIEKSKLLFMSISTYLLWHHLLAFLRSHWNVKLLKPVLTIYIACSLDYAQAILKSTSSEAYANLKLAEQLRKRNNGLKKKREEKAQTNQSPSHTSWLGSSSNFKCKCIRNRANRVESVLPRTTRERS